MKDRYRSAERLFDSLGGIDDSFIVEAQSFTAARRAARASQSGQRTRRWTLVAAVAALLVISLCVLPTALRTSMNAPADEGHDTSASERNDLTYDTAVGDRPNGVVDADDGTGHLRVSAVTTLLREVSTSHAPLDEQPALYDGQARLVWRCEGQLYAVSLNGAELARLVDAISADDGGQPIEHSEQLWLCLGDGRVISPELTRSAGNVAMGTLFDYSAELELSSSVIGCLESILSI